MPAPTCLSECCPPRPAIASASTSPLNRRDTEDFSPEPRSLRSPSPHSPRTPSPTHIALRPSPEPSASEPPAFSHNPEPRSLRSPGPPQKTPA